MGTGEGKSSVVIPIASIVEALTSANNEAFVSTVSGTLLEELKNKTAQLIDVLPGSIKNSIAILENKKTPAQDFIDDGLWLTMQKQALANGKYDQETNQEITRQYWKSRLEQTDDDPGLFPKKLTGQPRINFVSERDLVFTSSKDPKGFFQACPRIFMDEADVAYKRRTPYIRTLRDRFVTSEQIENSTYQWLVNYMIAKQLKPSDFHWFLGSQKLNEQTVNRFNLTITPENQFFLHGVSIIAKKLRLNPKETGQLVKNASRYLKENLPKKDKSSYILAVGDILAEMTEQKNRIYVIDEKTNRPVVRDAYMDELLESHENQPEHQLAILALNDIFDYVPFNQAIMSVTRFPTFIAQASEKLVCLSGTLMYPDPKTGKISKSNFAKFLEETTKKPVDLISPLDKKTVPTPIILDNEKQTRETILRDLDQQTKPTLVIDFNGVADTQQLFKSVQERFPDRKIAFLPPKPNSAEEEKKYNQYLARLCRQLANREIDVVVSSGTAGVGVNIIQDDGSFPDLHVALSGMPENGSQLTQAIGRRRLSGTDARWYLNNGELEKFVSYFPEETVDWLTLWMGKTDQLRVQEMIKEAPVRPEKGLSLALELLGQRQRKETENDKLTVEYDLFFRNITDRFREKLEKKLGSVLDSSQQTKINQYIKLMGIPESLYFSILTDNQFFPNSGDPRNFITNLTTEIFRSRSNSDRSWFEEQIDSWLKINMERVNNFYDNVLFDGRVVSEPTLTKLQPLPEQIFRTAFDRFPELLSRSENQPLKIVTPTGTYAGILKGTQMFLLTDAQETPNAFDIKEMSAFSIFPLDDKNELFAFFAKPA